MAAFRMAHEMKADMIELDVLLSKDGVPVVIHDIEISRVTNGRGFVPDYRASELQKMDAGLWFSSRYEGEKIPLLEEVLAWARDNMALNIEIKTEAVTGSSEGGIEDKVLGLVEKYGMEDHVLISSFDYRCVERVAKRMPQIALGLLYDRGQSAGTGPVDLLKKYGAGFFHCSRNELSRAWMEELEEYGANVLVYTVNSERKMRRFIRMGVRGIFSDRPDLLKKTAGEELAAR